MLSSLHDFSELSNQADFILNNNLSRKQVMTHTNMLYCPITKNKYALWIFSPGKYKRLHDSTHNEKKAI